MTRGRLRTTLGRRPKQLDRRDRILLGIGSIEPECQALSRAESKLTRRKADFCPTGSDALRADLESGKNHFAGPEVCQAAQIDAMASTNEDFLVPMRLDERSDLPEGTRGMRSQSRILRVSRTYRNWLGRIPFDQPRDLATAGRRRIGQGQFLQETLGSKAPRHFLDDASRAPRVCLIGCDENMIKLRVWTTEQFTSEAPGLPLA